MSEDHVVTAEDGGTRLDVFLSRVSERNRSAVHRLIEAGLVTVDDAPRPKSFGLKEGQVVAVASTEAQAPVTSGSVAFDVRYEDDDVAVVNKHPGTVVHPAPGHRGPTLVEALAQRMSLAPAAGDERPGIVHRLDKDTSGLLVVAKKDAAYHALVEAMKSRRIERRYLALTAGTFHMSSGRIDAPLGRMGSDRTKMGVTAEGRASVTDFEVLERLGDISLLQASLQSGRTHQIRVHLSYIGHPVIGDGTYGKKTLTDAAELGLRRMFLHAAAIRFAHPMSGEQVEIEEPLPADLTSALDLATRRSG